MSGASCPKCGYSGMPIFREDTGDYVCPQCGYVFPELPLEDTPLVVRDRERNRLHYEVYRGGSTTPRSVARAHRRGAYELERVSRERHYEAMARKLLASNGVPRHVVEEVIALLEKVQREDLLRGRSSRVVTAALLMHVSKSRGVQLQPEIFEKVAGASLKRVNRCYRMLLNSGVIASSQASKPRKPSQIVVSIAGKQGIREIFLQQNIPLSLVAQFADKAYSKLQGRKPAGVAAAVVYLILRMTNARKAQAEIARAAGVSPLTLRRALRHLVEKLDIEVGI